MKIAKPVAPCWIHLFPTFLFLYPIPTVLKMENQNLFFIILYNFSLPTKNFTISKLFFEDGTKRSVIRTLIDPNFRINWNRVKYLNEQSFPSWLDLFRTRQNPSRRGWTTTRTLEIVETRDLRVHEKFAREVGRVKPSSTRRTSLKGLDTILTRDLSWQRERCTNVM